MDFPSPGRPEQLDQLPGSATPDDGVVYNDHPLASQNMLDGIELYLDGEISTTLRRMDEGPADVMISNQAEFQRNPRWCFGSSRETF